MLAASARLGVVVVSVVGILLIAVSDLRQATALETQSKDVVGAALALEIIVLDLETGGRGFALTGTDSLVEPQLVSRRRAATDVTCRFFLPRRPAGGLSVLAAGQRTRQGVAVCWNRDSCRPPAETGPDPRNTAAGDLPAEAGRSPPPHTTNPMDTGVAHTPARFQYCRFFLTG